MFKQQQVIQKNTFNLRSIIARYPSWHVEPSNWLEVAEKQANQFVVPVPLVGAFSSGKSSLINAVIGSPLLSTNIDPETAVPAEVWHSNTENLAGCLPDGTRILLTREAIQNNQVSQLLNGGWVEASLPIPQLAHLTHLKLVDMPGWDSGIKAHSAAIDTYAQQSLAYGVVVSADEGNLRESIHKALKELAVRDMPIFVVITKADKKPPEEVQSVMAQVSREVEKTIGKPPFMVLQASARKKEIASFISALQEIENRAENLFATHATLPFMQQLASLSLHLDTLLNSDDLNSEQIAAQCAQLETDMKAFAGHLQAETAQLDARVQPVLGRIQQHMQNSLMAQLDSLTSDALSGRDLSGLIGTTLRLAVEEGIKNEFTPEVERYLDRVESNLPDTFNPKFTGKLNLSIPASTANTGSTALQLAPLVLPLLSKLHPVMMVLGPVLSMLISFFQNKSDRDREENQRREQAFNQIRQEIIPSVVSQACATLKPILHEQVAKAKQKIADGVEAKKHSHEAALGELKTKLAQGQAAYALACQQYQADQTNLNNVIYQLEQA
jgi:GTPase SAR1 family protein